MKKYIIMASVAALAIGLSSCSNFLDELPDNRTELNENNVGKILLSAYPISGQTLQNKIRTLPMNFGNLAIWQSLPATRF